MSGTLTQTTLASPEAGAPAATREAEERLLRAVANHANAVVDVERLEHDRKSLEEQTRVAEERVAAWLTERSHTPSSLVPPSTMPSCRGIMYSESEVDTT